MQVRISHFYGIIRAVYCGNSSIYLHLTCEMKMRSVIKIFLHDIPK